MTKNIIEFKNVTKTYEDSGTTVLKDITFEIEEGKFYTLLGASGSGKSTILNIIAGLLDATSGDILLDGQRINDVPTNKRDVHTIFQSYALFPNMTVFDNVAFALKIKGVNKSEIAQRVSESLKLAGKIAPARRLCYTNTYVGKIMFRRAVPHRVVPCAQTAGKRDTDENRI